MPGRQVLTSEGCVNKKPLLLSWGNEHRNHFIPLVPVEDTDIPHLDVGTAFAGSLGEKQSAPLPFPAAAARTAPSLSAHVRCAADGAQWRTFSTTMQRRRYPHWYRCCAGRLANCWTPTSRFQCITRRGF